MRDNIAIVIEAGVGVFLVLCLWPRRTWNPMEVEFMSIATPDETPAGCSFLEQIGVMNQSGCECKGVHTCRLS